ncbi:hypothetical protein ACFYZ8_26725 [Streptomyces sp. NPDC001668]|uniref:hypothetical protein n=1 Tax=unclassified Streptomyces TaxID=2593676 RepID=UPI00367C731B
MVVDRQDTCRGWATTNSWPGSNSSRDTGTRRRVGADQALERSGVTTAAFHYVEIPGRHVHLVDAARPLVESITRTLAG